MPRFPLAFGVVLAISATVMAEDDADGGAEAPSKPAPTTATFFDRLDENSDGKVSLDELPADVRRRLKPLFERAGRTELTADELEAVRKRAGTSRTADSRAAYFDLLDANGDGKLSLAETPERGRFLVEALLERAGKKPNGTLTKREFLAVAAGNDDAGGTGDAPRSPGLLEVLDADDDGRLSREELSKAASKFATLDANGDGFLELRELFDVGGGGEPSPEQKARMAELRRRVFDRIDANRDGRISLEEAPDRMRDNFDRLDADDDESVSFEEFVEAMTRRDERATSSTTK